MQATQTYDTQVGVRLRTDLLQQVDAARGRLGVESRADAARKLIEQGLRRMPAPPRPAQPVKARDWDDRQYLAAFEALVDAVNDMLDEISERYPVASIALANNASVGLGRWAALEAARHGGTVDQALATVGG